jgi:hypothetical protein
MDDYASTYISDRPWHDEILNIQTVVIEQGVTYVGTNAFRGCTALTSVTIPNSVISIGSATFYGCTALTPIVIPDRVETIGFAAFQDCTALTSIVIPDKVTSIGTYAFAETGLTSVTIPDSVMSIDTYVFKDCTNLTSVTVTGGLDSEGKITAGGIIDSYFTKDKTWKLKSAANAAESLILRDIVSLDYLPSNIQGTLGRELNYSDAEYKYGGSPAWDLVSCSVFGTLTVNGGTASAKDAAVYLKYLADTYYATIENDGKYTIRDIPASACGDITASLEGYHYQMVQISVQPMVASETVANIILAVNTYSVSGTLTVNGGSASNIGVKISLGSSGLYTADTVSGGVYEITGVPYGISGNITAAISGYTQTAAPVIPPLTGVLPDQILTDQNLTLTVLPSGYTVTFGSGSYYTVYASDGYPVSSPAAVTDGGSLTFRIQTSEGYSAYPSVSGNAKIILQMDGRYKISDIHSNVNVTVSVSADLYADPGNSGSGSGGDSGNGNSGSNTDSGSSADEGISYAVPIIAAGAFIACIGAAAAANTIIKRRKA